MQPTIDAKPDVSMIYSLSVELSTNDVSASKVEEYGRLVVARSYELCSKIRVQFLPDFLYRRASLAEFLSLDGIDILFVPAILEDSNLDVSCLPFYKDVLFLMMANFKTRQIWCFCPSTATSLVHSQAPMEVLRYYLGRRRPSSSPTGRWRAVYPPSTPLLNVAALDSHTAVCELMERLSLDAHPDQSPDVLSLSVGCSCEALVARIDRELRLRALERLPLTRTPARVQPQASSDMNWIDRSEVQMQVPVPYSSSAPDASSSSASSSRRHVNPATSVRSTHDQSDVEQRAKSANALSDCESSESRLPVNAAHQNAQRTKGNADRKVQSKPRVATVEPQMPRGSSRKRGRPKCVELVLSDLCFSSCETSDKECKTGDAHSSSTNTAGSESVASKELNSEDPFRADSAECVPDNDNSDNSEASCSSNCSTPVVEDELSANEESDKFYCILTEIRKQLTEFSTDSRTPVKTLFPPRKLMRESGKFHIVTGRGVSGKKLEQIIKYVLQRERHADVVSTSLRAAQHLELDDSDTAAMDSLALVSIAMYARVPFDLRTLEPLLTYDQAVEGNERKKGRTRRSSPNNLRFIGTRINRGGLTDVEAYRMLRIHLLLDAYKVALSPKIEPLTVFRCASMRKPAYHPARWMSAQLNRELIAHKDHFVAFTNALTYLEAQQQHKREHYLHIRAANTPSPIKHCLKLPLNSAGPNCFKLVASSSVLVKSEHCNSPPI